MGFPSIEKCLALAGVPENLWSSAQAAIDSARASTGGTLGALMWRKQWVRLFQAGKIAKILPWGANHLIEVRPDLAEWDIAPMLGITANGDTVEWIGTPDGGRPNPNSWMNTDPSSAEYQRAVAANYWLPGRHPREEASRKAWYRRNACEYVAWQRGMPVGDAVQEWKANGITVLRSGDAWQIDGVCKWLGPLSMKIDIGYEVGNVFGAVNGRRVQCWYPLPDHELRACAVWMIYPVLKP